MKARHFAMSLLAALGLSGCLPFAWANPPINVSGAVAASVDKKSNNAEGGAEMGVSFPVRASINPLQAFDTMVDRRLDVGVGYQMVPSAARPGGFLHGPFFEGAYLHPNHVVTGDEPADIEEGLSRFALRAQIYPAFSTRADSTIGLGGTIQAGYDWYGFMADTFDGCSDSRDDDFDPDDPHDDYEDDEADTVACYSGFGVGESGGGVFIEGSYIEMGDRRVYWGGVGLRGFLPASVGAGVAIGDLWSDD